MAKLNALELVNEVLKNVGVNTITSLSNLSGQSQLAWDALNEAIAELALEDHWKPLEAAGTITLSSNTNTYTQPSDMIDFDKDSFRYNEAKTIPFKAPNEVDREYITQTNTGSPEVIFEFEGYWNIQKIPDSSADGKLIKYRYWKRPSLLDTSTETGTCWVPEGFDKSVLVNLATFKVLHYRNNPEAVIYYRKVYGDAKEGIEGNLLKMKRIYRSPALKRVRVTAYF